MSRPEYIQFRATPEEKARIRQIAKVQERTISDLVRSIIWPDIHTLFEQQRAEVIDTLKEGS